MTVCLASAEGPEFAGEYTLCPTVSDVEGTPNFWALLLHTHELYRVIYKCDHISHVYLCTQLIA